MLSGDCSLDFKLRSGVGIYARDQITQWTEDWFNERGLHQLRGTIRYPKAA